jgi:AcrR family transcriptional regulator
MPEERPRQILEAAFRTFSDSGLANARLEEIAKRAGVSKATIYLYFPNKEELFREVVRHTVGDAIDETERTLKGETATEDLLQFMQAHWRFVRSATFPPLYRWVIADLMAFPDLAEFYSKEVIGRGHRLLRSIIERGIERGEFRSIDPAVAARMLIALLLTHGTWCHQPKMCPSIADRSDKQLLEEIKDFYLAAIRPAPVVRTTESHP